MPERDSTRTVDKKRGILVSTDAEFAQFVRSAFSADAKLELSDVNDLLRDARRSDIGDAAVVIVDLNDDMQNWSGLELLAGKVGARLPIVVVVRTFDGATARRLVQMRVADILVKPITPSELVRACHRVIQGTSVGETRDSKIFTFLPAAGGVGATTLAIQSAMTLLGGNSRKSRPTCLVDLSFDHGACADYLDIEPRFDFTEVEPNPERLDRQLLEGMVSHHSSGLAVIAAASRPGETRPIDQNVVMGLLNVVCQCYEHVVIDMPRTWYSWTDNVLLGSNRLFLVSDMTVPNIRRTKQLAAAISARLAHGPSPKVVVNRFERHFFAPGMRHKDLTQALGDAFAGTVPLNRRLVSEAIDRGVPLEDVQRGNNIAAAVKKLMFPRPTAKTKASSSPKIRGGALSWARP